MSQLQRLFQLASAAAAIGLCFNPTNAHALKLTLFDGTVIEGGNSIRLENIRKGGLVINAEVIAENKTSTSGINAITLKFTSLNRNSEVFNANPSIFMRSNFIIFENSFKFDSGTSGNVYQILSGNFDAFINNKVTFTGKVDNRTIAVQEGIPGQQTPFRFIDRDSMMGLGNNPTFVGTLDLNLSSNNNLNLPSSACILGVDREITLDEAENICEQSLPPIPEPSSAWSILVLGALGATSWLTRKRKFLQHNKD